MPEVNGKKYSYTKSGMAAAKKLIELEEIGGIDNMIIITYI